MPIQKPDTIGNDLAGAVSLRDYVRSQTEALHATMVQLFKGNEVLVDRRFQDLEKYFESQLDSIRLEYLDKIEATRKSMANAIDAGQRSVQAAMDANDKAIQKADAATEKRFESVNEFRQTLADISSNQIPRVEAMTRFDALADLIRTNVLRLEERITSNTDRLTLNEGSAHGLKSGWLFVIGLVGAVASAVAVFAIMSGGAQ